MLVFVFRFSLWCKYYICTNFKLMLCVALMPISLISKLAHMGAHEEDSVLPQTLTRRVVLHQIGTVAVLFSKTLQYKLYCDLVCL